MHPIACAAVANDEHTCYVMLVRREDESLVDLITRLDLTLVAAIKQKPASTRSTHADRQDGLRRTVTFKSPACDCFDSKRIIMTSHNKNGIQLLSLP